MTELSNAESALLGLLSEQPMYPYQIEQEVKFRDMRSWTELSMSSIYKLLTKLEKAGLVNRRDEIAENRLRKLYSISDAGREALQTKLTTLLREPEHIRWQVDIATYNCDLLPVATVREALTDYRKKLEENIKCYEELRKFMQGIGCPANRLSVAIRPVYLFKGEIEWVDAFLAELPEGD